MMRPFVTLQAGIPRKTYRKRSEPMPGMMRGMVVATYSGEQADKQGQTNPPQVLCDVLMVNGGVVRAQVMQRGSSVSNVSRWVPCAARSNVVTGAAVKLTQDGLDPPPASIYDLDGDMVVVEFLEGSVELPIIVGSIEHPRALRPTKTQYSVPAVVQGQGTVMQSGGDIRSRYLAHQGAQVQVDRAGNVRLDMRGAGVANDGKTYDAPDTASGNVDVCVRSGSEVVIRNQAGVPMVRAIADAAGNLSLRVGTSPTDTVLIATPTLAHLTQWEAANSAVGERLSALWAAVNIAAATATATGVPTPILIEPGALPPISAPYVWVAPPTADAVRGTLRSGIVRLDPTPEGG